MEVQEIWAAGDYPAVAAHLGSAARECVRRTAIGPGDLVLDVACGNGNAAILAAQAGADVVGLDITPELLDAGRAAAPVVEWVEGDAQALPFDDDSFDVVLSVFGCMFAPDHERTASEIARVLRPGGRLAIASWTPDGGAGQLFVTIDRHIPPPPDAVPPTLWGTEDHARALFPGLELTCTGARVRFELETPRQAVDFYAHNFGPVIAARHAVDDWPALHDDLVAFFSDRWSGTHYDGEYLILQATAGSAAST